MATPKLSLHKTKGVYYARFDGRMLYFGKDPAEAHQRFAEAYTKWENGEPVDAPGSKDAITTVEAAERYLAHCERYYGSGGELDMNRAAMRRLCALYGREPLANLSPKRLSTLQTRLVQEAKLTRPGINKTLDRVKRFLKWSAVEELCPAGVYDAARLVPGLRRGKTQAREPEPSHVPTDTDIFAVAEHMPGSLGDALRIQYYTGARPGEILAIRPVDVDTAQDVWRIAISEHKTAHHGHARTLYAGSKAQRILKPYLLRDEERYCFEPKAAYKARSERSKTHRRPDQPATPRKTARTLQPKYEVAAYRHALNRACKAAGVETFTPHKVRHAAAARFRREFGLDVTQKLLGHRHAAVSEIYAQADEAMAVNAISKLG